MDESTELLKSESSLREYVCVFSLPGGRMASLRCPVGGTSTIGRRAPADLVLDDPSVSREHVRIYAGSPPEIEDLGSLNGTKVMGRQLARGERVRIPFGSVIQVGGVVGFVQAAAGEAVALPPAPSSFATLPLAQTIPPGPGPRALVPSAVVRDETMRRLYGLLDVFAPSMLGVIVLGETGVGKDVFAEAIHQASGRRGRLVRINCAALAESLLESELFGHEKGAFTGANATKPGLIESADGGSVFLDEIGEMSLGTQAKLLRVVENREVTRLGSVKALKVDVRFIAATNRNLEAHTAAGLFRSDLYFRLNGISVTIPPLRERPDDILPLAESFLARCAPKARLSTEAARRLTVHLWPGNVRELKAVIERGAVLAAGGEILLNHLAFASLGANVAPPPQPAPPPNPPRDPSSGSLPFRDAIAEVERSRILEVMERCGGNQSRAAKQLGVSRTTLLKRLDEYGYVRPRKGQEQG